MDESLTMEDALQPLEADQAKRTNGFIVAVAASLVLHAVCSVILVGLPSGPASRSSVTYIDLTMPQHAAPMTVPAKKAEAKPAALPEKPVAVEKPAAEPLPQAQPAQPTVVPPAAAPQAKPDEDRSHTTLGLGLTRGYFKTIGEGETLRPGIKEYYLEMLQVINEKWWMDEQVDKRRIDPVVINLVVGRNGEIISSEIITSSGNRSYDKAVLASLTAASPLPPLPANYKGDIFQAPIRLVPPLNLMTW